MIMSAKATVTFQNNGNEFNVFCEPAAVFNIFKKINYMGSELKKIIEGSELYGKIIDSETYTIHSISVQGEAK